MAVELAHILVRTSYLESDTRIDTCGARARPRAREALLNVIGLAQNLLKTIMQVAARQHSGPASRQPVTDSQFVTGAQPTPGAGP
jgi:hypothetical protein